MVRARVRGEGTAEEKLVTGQVIGACVALPLCFKGIGQGVPPINSLVKPVPVKLLSGGVSVEVGWCLDGDIPTTFR